MFYLININGKTVYRRSRLFPTWMKKYFMYPLIVHLECWLRKRVLSICYEHTNWNEIIWLKLCARKKLLLLTQVNEVKPSTTLLQYKWNQPHFAHSIKTFFLLQFPMMYGSRLFFLFLKDCLADWLVISH